MRQFGRAESLKGHDAVPDRADGGKYAGAYGAAIEMYSAGTALAKATSKARAMQAKIAAQHVQQGRRWIIDGHTLGPTVDIERDGLW